MWNRYGDTMLVTQSFIYYGESTVCVACSEDVPLVYVHLYVMRTIECCTGPIPLSKQDMLTVIKWKIENSDC